MKSWSGTSFQVSFLLACVTFRMPNIVLQNLVLIYFIQLFASCSLSNAPTPMKVWVYPINGFPINGFPINGVDNTSPNAPEPLAAGTITLYFEKFS